MCEKSGLTGTMYYGMVLVNAIVPLPTPCACHAVLAWCRGYETMGLCGHAQDPRSYEIPQVRQVLSGSAAFWNRFGSFRTGSAASEQVWLLLNWLCCLSEQVWLLLNLLCCFGIGLAPSKLALRVWNTFGS